ncbi:hypothetical protein [Poriferisphaera sp. WC338]|uniref:hypothetical protein n=1 Tax=Poriferisphaera sp. WC338 TaxID=3425129 RepID=UPI003D814A67
MLKNTSSFTIITVIVAITLLLSTLYVSTSQTGAPALQNRTAKTRARIGIYQTRAVALAWVRSETQTAKFKELQEQNRLAIENGDIDLQNKLKQKIDKLRMQTFGTAPVDNIVEKISPEIPNIIQHEGVDALVSEVFYHSRDIELVDVTGALIEAYNPTDKTRELIASLLKKQPLTEEQIAAAKKQ